MLPISGLKSVTLPTRGWLCYTATHLITFTVKNIKLKNIEKKKNPRKHYLKGVFEKVIEVAYILKNTKGKP